MDQQTFAQQLHQGEVHEIYYFYGEEKLLIDRAVQGLKKAVLVPGLEDFNFDLISGEKITPKQIAEMAMNLPFMAEKRLLIVESPLNFLSIPKSDREGQISLKYLLDYLDQPNPQCCLVLRGEGPLPKTGALNKKLQEVAAVVEFAAMKGKALEQWIREYIANGGQQIEQAAVSYLSAMNSFDLEIMEKELDKLMLYTMDVSAITMDHVREIVTKTVEANIFELSDNIGNQKGQEALNVLHKMLYLGEPPLKILAMLVRHVQNLILVKDLRGQGFTDSEIREKTKLHPFVIKKSGSQSSHFSMMQLTKALEKLLWAEVKLKSTAASGEEVLERFVIDLCYL